jgi:hypothetical protein
LISFGQLRCDWMVDEHVSKTAQEQGSGIWHFRLTEGTEADARVKRSKKDNQSVRRVPVPPTLINDQLLDGVKEQRKGGAKLLFQLRHPRAVVPVLQLRSVLGTPAGTTAAQ